MNIYAIAVYPNHAKPIIATAHTNILEADPYKKLIEDDIKPLADFVRNQKGIHKIKIADGYFYGQINDDEVIIIITDDVIPASNLKQLIENVTKAKNSKTTLKSIIRNPENATRTKIDLLKEEIEEVKEIMVENIKKIELRGESLKELQQKSDELVTTAQAFKQSAKKLRQQACWDSFWPYRFYKWMWPPKEEAELKTKTEYEYTPANKIR